MDKKNSNKNNMLNDSINLILKIDEASSSIEKQFNEYYVQFRRLKKKIFNE